MSGPKYVHFDYSRASVSGATSIWSVVAVADGALLGVVSWFGRWRCYAFSPRPDTVYERTCLRDIAAFCEQKTAEHRKAKVPA